MTDIEVISAVCGEGKTTGMVNKIKESFNNGSDDVYVYITPYLQGCHDIAGTKPIKGDDYQRPMRGKDGHIVYEDSDYNLAYMRFKHPNNQNGQGSKAEGLRYLMSKGENIVSTHSLFLNLNLNTLESAHKYTLVIDESLDIYDRCKILPDKEIKKLLRLGVLYLKDGNMTVGFNRELFGTVKNLLDGEDAVEDTTYEPLATLCDNNQLLVVNGNVLVWEFSSEILKMFKKVYILTYLFEGMEMSTYLKKHKLPYTLKKGKKSGKDFKHLIDIVYDDKLNAIGDNYYDLSASNTRIVRKPRKMPKEKDYDTLEKYNIAMKRYDTYMEGVDDKSVSASIRNDTLRKNLHTVMTRWGAKSGDRYFTCISANKNLVAGKNYKTAWLPYSIRATNDYIETGHVAFLMNVFMQPVIKQACDSGEAKVDEDLVSLSYLIQFLFRSRLRKGEPIKLYIPSSRMRCLLEDYLEGLYD